MIHNHQCHLQPARNLQWKYAGTIGRHFKRQWYNSGPYTLTALLVFLDPATAWHCFDFRNSFRLKYLGTFKYFEFVRNDKQNCNGWIGTEVLVGCQYHYRQTNRPTFETFECLEVSCSPPVSRREFINFVSLWSEKQSTFFTKLEPNRLHNYHILASNLNASHTPRLSATNYSRGIFNGDCRVSLTIEITTLF